MMRRLTAGVLLKAGACHGHQRGFEVMFPDGMRLDTPDDMVRAMEAGINIWFGLCLVSQEGLKRMEAAARERWGGELPDASQITREVALAHAAGLRLWTDEIQRTWHAMRAARHILGKDESLRQAGQLSREIVA